MQFFYHIAFPGRSKTGSAALRHVWNRFLMWHGRIETKMNSCRKGACLRADVTRLVLFLKLIRRWWHANSKPKMTLWKCSTFRHYVKNWFLSQNLNVSCFGFCQGYKDISIVYMGLLITSYGVCTLNRRWHMRRESLIFKCYFEV